jgi:methionyl-tRNA formyltransferase
MLPDNIPFLIFTTKDWNIGAAVNLINKFNLKSVHVFSKQEDLNDNIIEQYDPRFIFFPHWSWIIPQSIYEKWECIVFHLGDVPDGRGGSPLQNHIERKLYDTFLSALKVTGGIDQGPVYLKRPISLWGSAEEIYMRIAKVVFSEMIPWILEKEPLPQEQQGKGTFFSRRREEQSDFKRNTFESLDDMFDLIRMLDADGYPHAYLEYGSFRLTFSRAQRKYGKVIADVEITHLPCVSKGNKEND